MIGRINFAAAALALSAASALAADLPYRKAEELPPPPPPPMWTGLYAGLSAGYGFGTNSATQSVSSGEAAYDNTYFYNTPLAFTDLYVPTGLALALSGAGANSQSGFIGGGQIGYNYQYGSNIVLGLEADIQGAGIRGSSRFGGAGVGVGVDAGLVGSYTSTYTSIGASQVRAGVDWLGTVRGRLGYLWTPTMLIYATGGLSYGGTYANISNFAVTSNSWSDTLVGTGSYGTKTFIGGGTRSQTLVGWNVGGGVEWMFMPNWSLKAEGIYWNLGNINVPTAAFAAAPAGGGTQFWEDVPTMTFAATRVNYQGVIARLGVNYHFNFGGSAPVVGRY
jgi:outer membrane immunogenic protein